MSINQESKAAAGLSSIETDREFENKRQLAARLGISVRTVDSLLAAGLPYIKLTRKLVRFPRAAVDEWLRQREVRRA
jgi:excisionase family DNA binding protein